MTIPFEPEPFFNWKINNDHQCTFECFAMKIYPQARKHFVNLWKFLTQIQITNYFEHTTP